MLFSPRITTKELAGLCRRLATSLDAGIDLRAVWRREAGGAGRVALLHRCGVIRDAVARGESLADALDATGDFFPPLFCQLAAVGEETGQLGHVFAQLADHFGAQLKRRRTFLAAITWPMVQLTLAVVIVGFLIWIVGVIGESRNTTIDILGLGLVGTPGLIVYAAIVSGVVVGGFLLFYAARRGLLGLGMVQRGLLRVPVLGTALQTLALARLAWALHLTFNTGMDVRRALRLSLESTQNARYSGQIGRIDKAIASGDSVHEAFVATGVFPAEFLDVLHVGEQSGTLTETMERLGRQYEDYANVALATLVKLAGLAVWCLVAVVLVSVIVRVFSFYIGTINDALKM